MHENQAHQIIDALSKDKYIYIALDLPPELDTTFS